MKLAIQVFQDSDDIKNGVIQLAICENSNSAYIFFTLAQWKDFKHAINEVEKVQNHVDLAKDLTDNPLHALYQDGSAIEIIFGGLLNIEMYFEGQDKKFWRLFKKAVNDFTPGTPKMEASQ